MYSILQNKYQLTDDQVFGNDKKTKKAQWVLDTGIVPRREKKQSVLGLHTTNLCETKNDIRL